MDVCILGKGINGHIAFNEPHEYLIPEFHIAELSKESMQHNMANQMELKPSYGLTMGMKNILQSKKILMLIAGKGKQKSIEKFLFISKSFYTTSRLLSLAA
jgi:galactosamine-6-phosphate isomerase